MSNFYIDTNTNAIVGQLCNELLVKSRKIESGLWGGGGGRVQTKFRKQKNRNSLASRKKRDSNVEKFRSDNYTWIDEVRTGSYLDEDLLIGVPVENERKYRGGDWRTCQ